MPTSLVGVNTLVPNRLCISRSNRVRCPLYGVMNQFEERPLSTPIAGWICCLENKKQKKCWVEIKNCTMVEGGKASFPDAVTTRGLKHLVEMATLLKKGIVV